MKKYLISPELNWYRANMHCHTTVSDGHYSPEKIKEEYKKMGYSIVAYTDHEIICDHSHLTDDEFLAITSSEFSINDSKPCFDIPQGEYMDAWRSKKVIHLGVYSKDPHNLFHPATDKGTFDWWKSQGKSIENVEVDGYSRTYTLESINETIRRLNEKGFLVSLNHPNWSLNDMDDYLNIEGLWSLEILNYATERISGAEYCPYIYDHMIRKGKNPNLFCNMGDDNHNRGGSFDHSFGGSTIIGAKELKYDQIISALENGEFYCASGKNPPKINALYVEDNVIKIDCSPATDIFLTGMGRNFRFANTDGEEITHAEFRLDTQDIMFRITVRDRYGNNAHTHFYKVKDLLNKEG
ncbi:MAG: PHP domain-containing protein [Clostridia bacterium]|nr:PHP domain-containing protein [Clostridia bacterium]